MQLFVAELDTVPLGTDVKYVPKSLICDSVIVTWFEDETIPLGKASITCAEPETKSTIIGNFIITTLQSIAQLN